MKVTPPPAPVPRPAASPAAPGTGTRAEHGRFQRMVQQLEHDMWRGAHAGDSGAPRTDRRDAMPAARHGRSTAALPIAPSSLPPLAVAEAAPSSPPDAQAVLAVTSRALAMQTVNDVETGPSPVAGSSSSLAFSSPASGTSTFDASLEADADSAVQTSEPATSRPRGATASDPAATAPADRLQVLSNAAGLSVAVRLREDRPFDPEQLKRTIARVLNEHRAGPASLYLNGTRTSVNDGGEAHGD